MELILSNFRCYKDKTFHFPTCVNFINGQSGKGKTTILLAIKYALFGNVKSVTTFEERKTMVTLKYQGITITRTSIPSRLVVKTNETTYEDGAAQAYLFRIFGPMEQFDATSYMIQKGTENFFSLSGAQKLHLLEQLSLLGENDINAMKDLIQADIKEKRKHMERLEHQTELLLKQVGTEPQFERREGMLSVRDVHGVINFLQQIQKEWEERRSECDQQLFSYSTAMSKQQESRIIYEKITTSITYLTEERNRLEKEYHAMVIPEKQREEYTLYKTQHEQWKKATLFSEKVANELRLFDHWLEVEQKAYERSEREWLACTVDMDRFHTYQGYQKKHTQWKVYHAAKDAFVIQLQHFQEWHKTEQEQYERATSEWNALTIDPAHLSSLEETIQLHDTFVKGQSHRQMMQLQKDSFDQWLEFQQTVYDKWKKEQDSLQVDTILQKKYEDYLIQHEHHLTYQSKQDVLSQQQYAFDAWFLGEQQTYQRLEAERQSLFVEKYVIDDWETQLTKHQQWVTYQRQQSLYQEKVEWYNRLTQQKERSHQEEIQQLEKQCSSTKETVDVEELQSQLHSYQEKTVVWKRINELKKKRPEVEVDLQLDILKKNVEVMERVLANSESRKNIIPCPGCKAPLMVQSQKIQSANGEPLSENDLKKVEEYKVKLPKVKEKYDKNYRESISREEDKKEIESLLRQVEGDSEVECHEKVDSLSKQIQDEKENQLKQLQYERLLQSKKKENPIALYASQHDEVMRLETELEQMEKGEESSIPIDTLSLNISEAKSKMERYQTIKLIDPVTTSLYRSKKDQLDKLISELECMEKGAVCPLQVDEVKGVLRDMKKVEEIRNAMESRQEPQKTVEYKKKHKELELLFSQKMDDGVESTVPIEQLRQEVWELVSRRDRQMNMKVATDPSLSKVYLEKKNKLNTIENELNAMDQGEESPVPIEEVNRELFEMQSKQDRQASMERIPATETTAEYKQRKQVVDELVESEKSMDQGQESPYPIDLVLQKLENWSSMMVEQQRVSQRITTIEKELVDRQDELKCLEFDDTDYQSLMASTKQHHQFIMQQWEYPTELIPFYQEYALNMIKYMKYKKSMNEIHENKRTCAIYYTQLEQLESLFQHIIQTEGVCLEQFIRRVNQKMKTYITHFFPDGSMHMEVCAERETKTGKIKNEICVQLIQNNHPTELKYLSGGEYDRCALAFMLAINELSHSAFLFLDESISSLDERLSEEVLEIIKEKQTELRKLVIIISHQAVTGSFENVIHI